MTLGPWEGLDVGRVSQQGLGRLGAKPSKAAITTHDFPITNSEDQGSYAAATPVIIFLVKITHIFTEPHLHIL